MASLFFRNMVLLMIMVKWGIPLGLLGQSSLSKPNFVVIFTDDQSYRAIGYNNPQVFTPHLDSLANLGLIFDLAFTASPVCVASRAGIFTGLYPQKNGTVALDSRSFIQNVVKEERYRTLPQLLGEAGYVTYFSGKSHLGDPVNYGFHLGKEMFGYDDKEAFEQVSQFVEGFSSDAPPFLIWLAPRQPHLPLHPSKEWLDLYDNGKIRLDKNFQKRPPPESFYNQGLPGERFYRDTDYVDNYKSLPSGPPRSKKVMRNFIHAYYATISNMDAQVGELIKHLNERSLLENTIFIFLSDNGYLLGNHGLGNKLTMHEESVRIPMFIFWKNPLMYKGRTEALVSTMDVMPTILDLAGIKPGDDLHGTSMRPILFDGVFQTQDYVASESVGVGGKLGAGHRMIRTKSWKYILSDENEEGLFNLNEDPFEQDNLINQGANSPQLKQLKDYYRKWRMRVGDKKILPSHFDIP